MTAGIFNIQKCHQLVKKQDPKNFQELFSHSSTLLLSEQWSSTMGHMAMSREIFSNYDQENATGIQLAETRDAAEHPYSTQDTFHDREYLSPNVNSAEVEKSCLTEKLGGGGVDVVGYRSYLTTKACNIYIPLLNLQSVCSYVISFHLCSSLEGWVLLPHLINAETQLHKLT